MSIVWEATSRSHVGNVRKVNEDSVFQHPQGMLWAVADGMGGYEAGDKASGMVVEELAKIKPCVSIDELVKHTKQQLRLASTRIQRYSNEQCGGRNVGSTVVCLLTAQDGSACVWAGDSRLYRLRDSTLKQISTDHSEVAKLVALGYLTEEEARVHPKANVITRTIGVGGDQGTEAIKVEVRDGDTFLLCSDGLYNELEDVEILESLQSEQLESIADDLINQTLARAAKDNVSIVLLRC